MTLEERVAALETQLQSLITNLGLNNTELNNTLLVLAGAGNTEETKLDTVQAFIDSTCTKIPPGCSQ
jgi:hypothetical protein